MTEQPVRELKDGDEIEFVPFTKQYGIAEFAFCPVWKEGRVRELHIVPLQQPYGTKERWRVECNAQAFNLDSWTHKGVELCKPWIWFWCEQHDCMGMRVYVPRNSGKFTVRTGSDISIMFDRGES
jgi:hypothetical protein